MTGLAHTTAPPVRIAMIDDSPADAGLVDRALKKMGVPHVFSVLHDGKTAVQELRDIPEDRDLPDLILLDLNLPGIKGHEILKQLKNEPRLNSIPVVILSTSSAPEDIRLAYSRQANAYVNKPSGLNEFQSTVEKIYTFWFDAALLPKTEF